MVTLTRGVVASKHPGVILKASAHFPKFVLHLSTHLSRTSESHGHQQTYDSSVAFLFDVPGSNLPLVVQERQIGGSRTPIFAALARLQPTRRHVQQAPSLKSRGQDGPRGRKALCFQASPVARF